MDTFNKWMGAVMNVASLELSKELDCNRKHYGLGYCKRHYSRLRNHGDTSDARTKHGGTGTKEFHAWCNMRYRCYKKNHPTYHLYGGRGITVYQPWVDSFEDFLRDMGKAPSEKHSIERLDNDQNYTPTNCVWADKKAQGNNTRRNKFLAYQGKTQTIAQWADELNIKYDTLYGRIIRGWSIERALTCK